jgi:hypothetical protein
MLLLDTKRDRVLVHQLSITKAALFGSNVCL